jgi:hypothetical protein
MWMTPAACRALSDAVCAAWLAGNGWRVIGLMLGVSRQAAHRRYGDAVHAAAAVVAGQPDSST